MEKAILVTVDLKNIGVWPAGDRSAELKELVRSSGAAILGELICRREKPTPNLFIGKGKFQELTELCKDKGADVVVFNNDLTSTQLRNLEKGMVGIKVVDRTQLILDIFALHAKSIEGKVQVELAQLEYLLPRLTGRGIELSRLGAGIGTRGPGEKILEYDRRRIRDRISKLKKELEGLENRRNSLRKRRKDAMLTTIAIVGYTNTGKTTLLNRLTNSKKLVADKLFSTLDPVARTFILPSKQKVIFLDTVGFLSELPHHLVESFKSTLEEVRASDLLLHVLDASSPRILEQDEAVHKVLKELKTQDRTLINVLNKIDLVEDFAHIKHIKIKFRDGIFVSALKGEGIEALIDEITKLLSSLLIEIKVQIPNNRMDTLNLIYKYGKVNYREDRVDSVYIEATVPIRLKDLI